MSSVDCFSTRCLLRLTVVIHGQTLKIDFVDRRHCCFVAGRDRVMHDIDVTIVRGRFLEKGIACVGCTIHKTNCHGIIGDKMRREIIDGRGSCAFYEWFMTVFRQQNRSRTFDSLVARIVGVVTERFTGTFLIVLENRSSSIIGQVFSRCDILVHHSVFLISLRLRWVDW